ncbi:MAG: SCO family protein [Novosphingobium sp.]
MKDTDLGLEPVEDVPPATGSLRWMIWLLAGVAVILAALAWVGLRGGGGPVDEPAFGGDFTLLAPDGSAVTRASIADRPFAIYFGFTRCPDVCPTMLASLARMRKALGPDGDGFRIVFVSVDPEHDKPAAIGEYVSLFDTPILGLTGSEAQLARIEKGFGIYVRKVPQPGGDYTVDHTAAAFLINRKGRLAGTIGHGESEKTGIEKLRLMLD